MIDFIAVSANIIYDGFDKDTIVIGMMKMPGPHNAENIKFCVEKIVNEYNIDKTKVDGICCDEGSALVRLFKQITNERLIQQMEELNSEDGCLSVDFEEFFEDEEDKNEDENDEEDDEIAQEAEDEENDHDDDYYAGDDDDNDEIILYSLANFDEEIQESLSFANNMNFAEDVEAYDEGEQELYSFLDIDETNEYDLSKGELINDLVINLGTDNLPRFSCASHKCNIAVRLAIKNHQSLCKTLAKLTNFAASTKRSINLIKLHTEKKSRLRCENLTRWSSSFLMLNSFHKSYMKGVFNNTYSCPVPLNTINMYLKILLPAYQFSLLTQKSKKHIGEVISALLLLFEIWKDMRVRGDARMLKLGLLEAFEKKFKFELESHIYLVAALFDVSKLKTWFNEKSNESYAKSASDAIEEVVFKLVYGKNEGNPVMTRSETFDSVESENDGFFKKFSQIKNSAQPNNETSNEVFRAIHKEKVAFLNYLNNKDLKSISSTRSFWSKKASIFPNLSKAEFILYNIPACTAFIERFFSICGITCRKNAGNMSASMIIKRSMLKANLNLLEFN